MAMRWSWKPVSARTYRFESCTLRNVRNCKAISTLLERWNLFHKFLTLRSFMFYYVYILRSLKDSSLYIGYTSDLRKRIKDHNSGKNLATKPYIPYKLIFYEAFLNRIDAINREGYLKNGYGRRTITELLNRHLNNTSNPYKDVPSGTSQKERFWKSIN